VIKLKGLFNLQLICVSNYLVFEGCPKRFEDGK